jgi:hypothetical protein
MASYFSTIKLCATTAMLAALILSACSTPLYLVGDAITNELPLPYDASFLLTRLHDTSIAVVRDHPDGTGKKYLQRYTDTLSLLWSTEIYSSDSNDFSISPMFMLEGTRGITVIYRKTMESVESIEGMIFDQATGKKIHSAILVEPSEDNSLQDTRGAINLRCSSDSSKLLLYQLHLSYLEQEPEARSMTTIAHLIDADLQQLGSDTMTLRMDGDIPMFAERNRFSDITIDNAGHVFQTTLHGASVIQVSQWNVRSGTVDTIRWTIPGEDLLTQDARLLDANCRTMAPGIIYVAVPIATEYIISRSRLVGVGLASFDFNQRKLGFSTRYDLTDSLVRGLTNADMFASCYLAGIFLDPSQQRIVLPLQHVEVLTDLKYNPSPGTFEKKWERKYSYNWDNLMLLAFDRNGTLAWQRFVQRPIAITGSSSYKPDWWGINNDEIRILYVNNANIFFVRRMSLQTGTLLSLQDLLSSNLTPYYFSCLWSQDNSAILRLGGSANSRLIRVTY